MDQQIYSTDPLRPKLPLTGCEDCGNTLDTSQDITRNDMDMDLMDIDAGDELSCSACGRKVCDTCAVRRDRRMCLECVNHGNKMISHAQDSPTMENY